MFCNMGSGHFWATSAARFRRGTELDHLLRDMERDGLNFDLYYVPHPVGTEYSINNFAPDISGAICIAQYEKEPKE